MVAVAVVAATTLESSVLSGPPEGPPSGAGEVEADMFPHESVTPLVSCGEVPEGPRATWLLLSAVAVGSEAGDGSVPLVDGEVLGLTCFSVRPLSCGREWSRCSMAFFTQSSLGSAQGSLPPLVVKMMAGVRQDGSVRR